MSNSIASEQDDMNKILWNYATMTMLMACIGNDVARAQVAAVALPQKAAASNASSALAIILNPEQNVSSRFKAVHWLENDLEPSQISVVCRFIKALPDAREKNLPALQLIKNDLMNVLMEQNSAPAQLTDVIIAVYEDTRQDYVTRDYALQHLVTWYEQRAAVAPDAKSRIRQVLWKAAKENSSMAGTALLGLHRLAKGDGLIDRGEVSNRALAMALDPQTTLAARITTLQVCAEEHVVEALPAIRSLAFSDSQTALRVSAIAALGRLGGPEDLMRLKQLVNDPDSGLRVAIQAAITRLEHEFRIQKVV